jgi:RNA polymerase sigma-70 factor (ECF subfamily)
MDPGDELIERARRGDRDAFGALIEPVLTRALRLAVGVLGDRQAAEDATQDAVVTAWRKLGNVRAGAPIEPWFLAIVANRCRKVWRQRNRPTVPPDLGSGESVADRVADRHDVYVALGRLPVQHRLLVVLRYYFDLPIDDAARIAGIPTGTAKSRLHRALASLRVDLEGVESTHG